MKAQSQQPAKPFGSVISGKDPATDIYGGKPVATSTGSTYGAKPVNPATMNKGGAPETGGVNTEYNLAPTQTTSPTQAALPQAPPGYYYTPDGTLLLGGSDQSAASVAAAGGTPAGGAAGVGESGLNAAHSNWGSTVNTVDPFGSIQQSTAPAGAIQGSIASGGPIQQKLDLSGLGGYTTSANYGRIQDDLDNSNLPALASGDALGTQMTQAQQAAYQNATGYLDPQWQNDAQAMENRLVNQGVMQNSEAWNKAMSQFGREKEFAYNQAYTGAYDKGLNAQNQLFGQGLAVNQNQFGQNLATGQFHNAAQQQGFGQSLSNAQLANQARQAQANELIAAMGLNNAAQAQGFDQSLAQGTFANTAQAQGFGQGLASQAANNAAQNQGWQQGLAGSQFTNATQQQLADQWLRQFQTETGLRQTETSANAQMAAANASAGASTANMNAQLAAQQEQNRFLNSMTMRNQDIYENQLPNQYLLQMLQGLGGNTSTQQPNFTQTPNANVGGVDLASLFGQQYNGQLNGYNAQVGQQNSQTNAFATILAAYLSDRRLKKNVRQIGVHAIGVPVYEYDYLWGEHATGVMADELEQVLPDAVFTLPNGFQYVNYARL